MERLSVRQVLGSDPVVLGRGGQGRVYAAPGLRMQYADQMVFKRYSPQTVGQLDVAALDAMPAYLESLPLSRALQVLGLTAWPCRLVEDERGAVCGFVMPAAPDRFIGQLRLPSGKTTTGPQEFQRLLNSATWLANRGISLTRQDRLGLIAAMAAGLERLHEHDIGVGDLSPTNVLFSLEPEPDVYFLDCDAMLLKGRSPLKQVETPGWKVRELNPSEPLGTPQSDSYKLGLLALRLLTGTQDARRPHQLPADTPRRLQQLITDSLNTNPSKRPTLAEWTRPAAPPTRASTPPRRSVTNRTTTSSKAAPSSKTTPSKEAAGGGAGVPTQASGGSAPKALIWQRVTHDEAVFGGRGRQEMRAVVVGGPGLVAVGQDHNRAAVWTSSDGRTWQRVAPNEAEFGGQGLHQMLSVAAGGPGLVAVGRDRGRASVWISTDGQRWARAATDDGEFGASRMASVTVFAHGLVAVGRHGSSAAVWLSSDGRNWERVKRKDAFGYTDKEMTSVTAWERKLVAVGRNNVNWAVWTSPDGHRWDRFDQRLSGNGRQVMSSVTVGGPGLVAVGRDRTHAAVWTSTDGEQWNQVADDPAVFGVGSMACVTAAGSGLIACGDAQGRAAMWTSPDGLVWQRVAHNEKVFGGQGKQALLSVVAFGHGFVAVGSDQHKAAVWAAGVARKTGWQSTSRQWKLKAPKNPATARKTSPPTQNATPKDAMSPKASGGFAQLQSWHRVSWDESVFGGTGKQFMSSVAAGRSALVAVGHDSSSGTAAVWTSSDGWTWQRVVHDEAVFGGRGGQMMTSVATWNSGLVAVGCDREQAAVWLSVDGKVWQRIRQDKVFGGLGHQEMLSVASLGQGLVAVGHDRNLAAVWTSADGHQWERVAHDERVFGGPGEQRMESVAAVGPRLVAVGNDNARAAVWVSKYGRYWQRVARDQSVFDGDGEQGIWSVTVWGQEVVAVGTDRGRPAVWICGAAVTSGQQGSRHSTTDQSEVRPAKQSTPPSGTVASTSAVPPSRTAVVPRGGPIRASSRANRNRQSNNPSGSSKALRQTPKQAGRFDFVGAILLLAAIGLVVLYFALS